MKKRWIVTGVAVVSLVAATAGIAYAAGRGSGTTRPPAAGGMAAHDAMHDSPAMQAMHDQMPAALQAKCDALHEQMDQMMAGMMGGSGMMGGEAGNSGRSMDDHHPSTEG